MQFPARPLKFLDLTTWILFGAIFATILAGHRAEAVPKVLETDRYIVSIEKETAKLYGKFPSGNVFTGEHLEVTLTQFQEVSQDTISLSAPETVAYRSTDASTTFVTTEEIGVLRGNPPVNATIVTQTLNVPAGSVNTQFSVFKNRTTLNYGPLNVSVVPDSIKLGFFCSNWTFAPTSAAWRFWLNFTIYTPDVLQIQRYEFYDSARDATGFFVGTPSLNITLYFQTKNVLDGTVTFQRFTDYTYQLGTFDGRLGVRFAQAWQYSRFASVIYDPDFSILVTISEPPTAAPLGVAPNGAPQSQIQAPQSVSDVLVQASFPVWIPIVVVMCVLLVAAAIAGVLFYRKRQRNADEKARLNSLVTPTARPSGPDSSTEGKSSSPQTSRNTARWTMADSSRAALKPSATKD
eukprot:TRINITY_DN1134_c0_g1_i1.p1 TRINITY_DN1134_c0_g1~~TRINITY_DN1134_c0_g1_i1.p1  ORF type:complete len:406 (-),score=57.21 TRINITY_DN1134_c0_g1_i1:41-1258(-)